MALWEKPTLSWFYDMIFLSDNIQTHKNVIKNESRTPQGEAVYFSFPQQFFLCVTVTNAKLSWLNFPEETGFDSQNLNSKKKRKLEKHKISLGLIL